LPVDVVFHDRLTVKSKYSKPLVAWRFQMDAAMDPWRHVFTGVVAGFFLISFISDSFHGFSIPDYVPRN
jgi:hypothetical protein